MFLKVKAKVLTILSLFNPSALGFCPFPFQLFGSSMPCQPSGASCCYDIRRASLLLGPSFCALSVDSSRCRYQQDSPHPSFKSPQISPSQESFLIALLKIPPSHAVSKSPFPASNYSSHILYFLCLSSTSPPYC